MYLYAVVGFYTGYYFCRIFDIRNTNTITTITTVCSVAGFLRDYSLGTSVFI